MEELPPQGRAQTDLSRVFQPGDFNPLGDIYAFLGKKGADLTYVDFLREELELGDACFKTVAAELQSSKSILLPLGWELSKKVTGKKLGDCFRVASEKDCCGTLSVFLEAVANIHYGHATTGRPSDRWGTFFMICVCEHLRDVSGRQYQLGAIRLLKKTRGEKFRSPSTTEKTRKLESTD
jgi:hypothetical protein